jgi:hypothetical protein
MYAYAWASGKIEFGVEVPEGAIKIAQGYQHMQQVVEICANHFPDENVIMVPGILKGDTEENKLEAFLRFRKLVDTSLFELYKEIQKINLASEKDQNKRR